MGNDSVKFEHLSDTQLIMLALSVMTVNNPKIEQISNELFDRAIEIRSNINREEWDAKSGRLPYVRTCKEASEVMGHGTGSESDKSKE